MKAISVMFSIVNTDECCKCIFLMENTDENINIDSIIVIIVH